MTVADSPYNSNTFGNSLSLRVDGGVGAVSINPSGRDVVLAGHRGLYVVDLDDPFSPPRWIQHLTSWEVADVQWSPHYSKPAWVISTSNQKAMLWNLARTGDKAIEHVLHQHSRAITDINFHPDNPELLATCSVDTSILAWDMRSPKRAIYSVADWRAGTSQVKWNFQNPNILASSHDNYFYVWDLRNNTKPLHKIEAHNRKINGVDFSRTKENEIISSSNDRTVKFWDLSKSTEEPTSIINTNFPVWRARHLPFGHGCAIMPLRGGSDAIYLVNHRNLSGTSSLQPSSTFKGHTDRVTDFLWRQRHTDSGVDDREFQLVTWSKDCDLRLWSLDDEIYDKLDFERGEPMDLAPYDYSTYREEPDVDLSSQPILKKTKDTFVSSKGDSSINTKDHLNWISGVRIGRSAFIQSVDQNPNNLMDNSPDNLGEEVTIIGHKFPKVKFEKISVSTGTLVLSLNGPWGPEPDSLIFLRVEIRIPHEYPSKAATFRIEENSNLDSENRQEIISNLNKISTAYAKFQKFSLESTLRYIMGEKIDLTKLEQDSDDQKDDFDFDDLRSLPSSLASDEEADYEEEDDDDEYDELIPLIASEVTQSKLAFDSTPIPKGCGASWTKTGQLVCFFIPKNQEKEQKVIKFDERGISKQVFFDYDNASDDSLSDDWNDILKKEENTRNKIPGVFRLQNFNPKNKTTLSTEKSLTNTNQQSKTVNKNVVAIIDMNHLIPAKMELAEEYKVIGDTPKNLALYNAEICAKYNYTDLADSWRMLSTIFNQTFYWGGHPFGRFWFVKELMDYYEKLGNVQMLAMMSCVIQGQKQTEVKDSSIIPTVINPFIKESTPSIVSHTPSSFSDSNYRLPFSRSSSVITTDKVSKTISVKIDMLNEADFGFDEKVFGHPLLDPNQDERFNRYRDEYANILYNWGQVLRRAEILKFNFENACLRNDPHQSKIEWVENAYKDCCYCGLKVNRRLFSCFTCEHVLHADCAGEWFRLSNECPSGCGCLCIEHIETK